MNKRYYEHTLPIIRGSLSNTYENAYFFFKYLYMFWPITYIVTETEGLRELFYFWLDDREKASR